ncbi:MAG: NUDIX hydrolase [Gemmatimonadetes bacterium]|nr:NUDIX hydrolase [Gemmatimonadota bacterium]
MTRAARARRETSAGGVVFRRDGDRALVLLIRDAHRNWSFPKGHLERDERPEDAAVREVREETGLANLEVVAPISTIEWTFRRRGVQVHKTCHFFALTTPDVRTKPQRGEGITACRWVTLDQGERMLTHDSARGVLAAARVPIAEFAAAPSASSLASGSSAATATSGS